MVVSGRSFEKDFASVVHGVLERAGVPAADRLDCHCTGEVARVVEYYLGNEIGRSRIGNDMWRLTAKALRSAGEYDKARKVLAMTSGVLRRSSSLVGGGHPVWIMDLQKLSVLSDERLEILLFTAIGMMLDSAAGIWDESSGRGVLGLRNLASVCRAVRDKKRNDRQIRQMVFEIKRFCASKLDRIGSARSWKQLPVVIDMDYQR